MKSSENYDGKHSKKPFSNCVFKLTLSCLIPKKELQFAASKSGINFVYKILKILFSRRKKTLSINCVCAVRMIKWHIYMSTNDLSTMSVRKSRDLRILQAHFSLFFFLTQSVKPVECVLAMLAHVKSLNVEFCLNKWTEWTIFYGQHMSFTNRYI